VEVLQRLEEPWQGNFLEYIAGRATGGSWNGRARPSWERVRSWLEQNPYLHYGVVQLLSTWSKVDW